MLILPHTPRTPDIFAIPLTTTSTPCLQLSTSSSRSECLPEVLADRVGWERERKVQTDTYKLEDRDDLLLLLEPLEDYEDHVSSNAVKLDFHLLVDGFAYTVFHRLLLVGRMKGVEGADLKPWFKDTSLSVQSTGEN